ncbi:endo-beta-1,3-1,4 glucanase [Vibrio ishigakensis]|uniref:Beta-glucanase n=1 Tax=Vibrio ishigakensis TaxID=1481914 RepID=A0A0B8PHU9_9VIBR|nr:endo-beta-1,3-1,4 glucanase [Vibrio ishigakensis]
MVIAAVLVAGCHSTATLESTEANQDTRLQTGKLNTTDVPLYGAEVYSLDKVKYGRFVMRMKLVSNPGVVSSFFTYDNESWQGNLPWREIDIEMIGKQPNQLQTNLITGELNQRVHSETIYSLESADDFHIYELVWTPDEIIWLVDGEVIHKETAESSEQVIDMRDTPQSYRMNLWVSEAAEWVGAFDKQDLPLYQYVDWMEYHSFEEGEFVLRWRDNFTHFDRKRWGAGDWSFDSNLVTFAPYNVFIEDEMLVLALTTEE